MLKKTIFFLASLKLAVIVILALAAFCATATVLESLYDTATARFWVYQSIWFRMVLVFFGINIFSVMVSRWPWKKAHLPFLLAHIGILTLLFGSYLTDKTGTDGSLRISEGDQGSIVEIDQPMLVFSEGDQVRSFPVKWLPPGVAFHPYSVRAQGIPYDIDVTGFMPHADVDYDFIPRRGAPFSHPTPALKFKLTGGPMRITQDFTLWTGDASTQSFQAGPAWFEIVDRRDADRVTSPGPDHGPRLSFFVDQGKFSYRARSSTGEVVQGSMPYSKVSGAVIDPHWKAVQITLNELILDAEVDTKFRVSRMQYGDNAPPSAVEVSAGGSQRAWLGMGSRVLFLVGGHHVEIGYFHRRLMLPFSVKLDRFNIDHYQGTANPASYASDVTVFGETDPGKTSFSRTISMNEPLEYKGFTLYQASFEDATPRPVTTILSVNRDPGRRWKYLGSILIVLGSILLFARKYRKRKAA